MRFAISAETYCIKPDCACRLSQGPQQWLGACFPSAGRVVTIDGRFPEPRESRDGIRGLAAYWIILGHEAMLQRRNESRPARLVPGSFAALASLLLLACVPDAPGDPENVVGPGPNPPLGEYRVLLRWDAPDKDAAGEPLEDLAGFRLYFAPDLFRRDADEYSLETGMDTEALVTGLSAGSWQFAVTAIDTAGNESDLSEVVLVEVGAE
jgi:hypothetical protein